MPAAPEHPLHDFFADRDCPRDRAATFVEFKDQVERQAMAVVRATGCVVHIALDENPSTLLWHLVVWCGRNDKWRGGAASFGPTDRRLSGRLEELFADLVV